MNTATIEPTATNVPWPTAEHMQNLQSDGYKLYSSGAFTDDAGIIYTAYVLTNAEQSFYITGGEPSPDAWRIAFYKWDGTDHDLLGDFPAPTYHHDVPQSGYPFSYNVVDWVDLSAIPYGDFVQNDSEAQQFLNKQGARNDINQNGFPEFALSAAYCPFSCSWPQMALHFYEIQDGSGIHMLTENLPGRMAQNQHPETGIVHATDPLNYYVDEHFEYFAGIGFDVWWIYEWDGTRFVDVTKRYADEYQNQVQEVVTSLAKQYGKPYAASYDLDILKIPFILDKPGLREAGVTTLLEVTNPENWPGSGPMQLCWLQLVSALAQEEYESGGNFSSVLDAGFCLENLSECLTVFDLSSYDLSSCDELLP
jgi:hypothetical protein